MEYLEFVTRVGPAAIYKARPGWFGITKPRYYWKHDNSPLVYGPFDSLNYAELHLKGHVAASGRIADKENVIKIDFKSRKRI